MGRIGSMVLGAALLAAPGVARAGQPVLLDREATVQRLQAVEGQLAGIEQLLVGLAGPPSTMEAARTSLRGAQAQLKDLQRVVRQAAGAGTGYVTVPPPPVVQPPVVVVQQPPPPPPPPPPWSGRDRDGDRERSHDGDRDRRGRPHPMFDGELEALVQAINAESFSENKLSVMRDAASRNFFLTGQAVRLLSLFTFSPDKLGALEVMAPRILDRDNTFRIYQAFTFSADKESARQILERQ